jgi:type I restriction enzyme M protein
MNRRVYDGCCGSGGMVVQADRFVEVRGGQRGAAAHIGLKPSRLSQQLRVLRRGLGPRQQTGTTVTYTFRHPLVVDLLTISPVTAPRGHQRPDGVTDRTANRCRRPVNAPEQG